MNGVALGNTGMTIEAARQRVKHRKEWRAEVLMLIEFHAAIFEWFLCCFGLPSSALVAYHLKRGGMPLHGAVGANCEKGESSENQGAGA